MSRVRVAAVAEMTPGTGREIVVEDRVIALYRVGDEFFALDGICPHAGGPLGKGVVSGTRVTCPWHGWQFDVRTGRHCLSANIAQETLPVEVEHGEVYVVLSQ